MGTKNKKRVKKLSLISTAYPKKDILGQREKREERKIERKIKKREK